MGIKLSDIRVFTTIEGGKWNYNNCNTKVYNFDKNIIYFVDNMKSSFDKQIKNMALKLKTELIDEFMYNELVLSRK